MFLHALLWLTLAIAGWAWFSASLTAPAALANWRPHRLSRWTLCVLTAVAFWAELFFAIDYAGSEHTDYYLVYGPPVLPLLPIFLPLFAVTLGFAHVLGNPSLLSRRWARVAFRLPFAALPFVALSFGLYQAGNLYHLGYLPTSEWILILSMAVVFLAGTGWIALRAAWQSPVAAANAASGSPPPAATAAPAASLPAPAPPHPRPWRRLLKLTALVLIALALHLGVLYLDQAWLRANLLQARNEAADKLAAVRSAAPPGEDPTAAAKLYQSAMTHWDQHLRPTVNFTNPDDRLTVAMGEAIGFSGPAGFAWLAQHPPDDGPVTHAELSEFFERHTPDLEELHAATRLGPCPFGPHGDPQPNGATPLNELTSWAYMHAPFLLNRDAAWQLAEGCPAQAFADFQTATQLAQYACRGATMIDWLIAAVAIDQARQIRTWLVNDPGTPDDLLAQLAAATLPRLADHLPAASVGAEFESIDEVCRFLDPRAKPGGYNGVSWLAYHYGMPLAHLLTLPYTLERDRARLEAARALGTRPLYECQADWARIGSAAMGPVNHQGIRRPCFRPSNGENFQAIYNQNLRVDAHVAAGQIVVAAERYRRAKGAYPTALVDLLPEFLASLPLDPLNGQPFHLKGDAQGLIIYSVGENGRDDGGASWELAPYEGDADDLVELLGQPYQDQVAKELKSRAEHR